MGSIISTLLRKHIGDDGEVASSYPCLIKIKWQCKERRKSPLVTSQRIGKMASLLNLDTQPMYIPCHHRSHLEYIVTCAKIIYIT